MANWKPKVNLSPLKVSQKDYQFLLESLAKLIYDHLCQAQLNLKLSHSIESNQNQTTGFKKADSA